MLNLFCATIARFCSDASRVSTSERPKVRLVGAGLLPLGLHIAEKAWSFKQNAVKYIVDFDVA